MRKFRRVKSGALDTSSAPRLSGTAEFPIRIVNLPADDDEAPLAESKFKKAVQGLSKVYPDMEEARATVKVSSPLGERRRFEVEVLVRVPGHNFGFRHQGWSLAETFDRIVEKMKRLMTKPREKPAYRRRPSRSERESARAEMR